MVILRALQVKNKIVSETFYYIMIIVLPYTWLSFSFSVHLNILTVI